MSQIQAGPYQPIHFYDAPEVVLTQVLDDEATFGSFVDTFFNPDNLSPIQRDEYAGRMKKDLGFEEKGVGSALVDVVTNPLVWLGFLFLPAGLSASGRLFTQNAKNSLSAQFLKNFNEMFMGTPAPEMLGHMSMRKMELLRESANILTPAQARYAERMGLTKAEFMDPMSIKNVKLRSKVEQDQRLLFYHVNRMHKGRMTTNNEALLRFQEEAALPTPSPRDVGFLSPQAPRTLTDVTDIDLLRRLNKQLSAVPRKGTTEIIELEIDGVRRRFRSDPDVDNMVFTRSSKYEEGLLDVPLDRIIRERGLMELSDAYTDVFRQRAIRNYMKEGTTLDEVRAAERIRDPKERLAAAKKLVDYDKVVSLKSALKGSRTLDEMVGLPGFFDVLLSREMRANFLSGKNINISDKVLVDNVVEGMATEMFQNGRYFPRNLTEFYQYKKRPGKDWGFEVATGRDRPMIVDGVTSHRNVMAEMFASGRNFRRTTNQVPFHEDDLMQMYADARAVGGDVTQGWQDHLKLNRAIKDNARPSELTAGKTEGRVVPFRRMHLNGSYMAYEQQTARDFLLYVDKVPDIVLQAQREAIGAGRFTVRGTDVGARDIDAGAKTPPNLMVVMDEAAEAPLGGWKANHVLQQSERMLTTIAEDTAGVMPELSHLRGDKAARLLQEVAIPQVLGMRLDDHNFTKSLIMQTQAMGKRMANSKFAKDLIKEEPGFKDLFDQMRYYADRPATELVDPIVNRTAGYLYSSHLGLNMASVILNLQQPFLHLSTVVGVGDSVRGMANAYREMARYAKRRAEIPRLISSDERDRLLRETLEFPDEVGLTGDVVSDLDKMMETSRLSSGKLDPQFLMVEGPMKLFEKAEWINRMTTVHALKHNYIRRGLASLDAGGNFRAIDETTDAMFRNDARKAVVQFQFGADVLGTPAMFVPGASKILGTPSILTSPLMRQFQSFGLRSLTSLFYGGANINQGMRGIRGTNMQVPYYVADPLRMVGISALLYEGFKGTIGADVSRAGAIDSLTAFIDPERALAGEVPFVIPPVIGISGDLIRGVVGADAELIGNAMARSIPGGIALQRALQVAPDANQNFLTSLAAPAQKFYADYDSPTPDGMVPVYKSDGSLVDYQQPTSLILRALGVNLSLPQYSRDIDGYMVKQRAKMNDYRRKWIEAAIRDSDVAEAERINEQFLREYGFRLPVTKDQVKAFIKGAETPRSLRMMDRLPPEMRSYFQQEMARDPERLGTEATALELPTTSSRRESFPSETPVSLSPEVLQALKKAMAETEQQRAAVSPEVFEAFGGF